MKIEWIEFYEDNPPDPDVDVFVCILDTHDKERYMEICYHNGHDFCVDGGMDDQDVVTHWAYAQVFPENDAHCGTCGNGHEGTCEVVAGQNYGSTSEISDGFVCANYARRNKTC